MTKKVRVLLGGNGLPSRVFRKDKEWLKFPLDSWIWLEKKDAVALIRLQVFNRAGGIVENGESVKFGTCEECEMQHITWDTMQMHEKIFKGKGGEVSLENCMGLCHDCHQGSPDSFHGDRRWQSAKLRA